MGRARIMLMLVALFLGTARADDVRRARRLFKRAETHFAAREYRRALKLYQRAYLAKPLPGFHFNIGQCHRNLAEYEKAIHHFEQYLELSKRPRHRKDAQQLITLSREELAAQEAAMPPRPPPAVVTHPPPPAPTRRKGIMPYFFWTGVGITAALFLTGTITGSLALAKSSEYQDPSTPHDQLQDLKDSGESLKIGSSVTFGLGLASAIGTAVLFFVTDFRAKETKVTASPAVGGGMVLLEGRF